MGLIRMMANAVSGQLADQYKDYYSCDSLPNTIAIRRGIRRPGKGNNQGNADVITNGSIIAVADGQCAIIVEDGLVAEVVNTPGAFEFNTEAAPTIFKGEFKKGILDSLKQAGKRMTFAGDVGNTQAVFYLNTKQLVGNKFGSATPLDYRDPKYRTIDISYYGMYTLQIDDPVFFYKNLAGNVTREGTTAQIVELIAAHFDEALKCAISLMSDTTVFTDLTKSQAQISKNLRECADGLEMCNTFGITITDVAIQSINLGKESKKRVNIVDDADLLSDPKLAAGRMVAAQAQAMETAAGNTGGAMSGFMGMGMAGQSSGNVLENVNSVAETRAQTAEPIAVHVAVEPAPSIKGTRVSAGWKCSCGAINGGKFCSECGSKPPVASVIWKCSCGEVNDGKFCKECGSKQPISGNWKCDCGVENDGKFCKECGRIRK